MVLSRQEAQKEANWTSICKPTTNEELQSKQVRQFKCQQQTAGQFSRVQLQNVCAKLQAAKQKATNKTKRTYLFAEVCKKVKKRRKENNLRPIETSNCQRQNKPQRRNRLNFGQLEMLLATSIVLIATIGTCYAIALGNLQLSSFDVQTSAAPQNRRLALVEEETFRQDADENEKSANCCSSNASTNTNTKGK